MAYFALSFNIDNFQSYMTKELLKIKTLRF